MDKKEAIMKMRQMSIEAKVAMLSETEEAYIRGFMEGAILFGCQTQKQSRYVKPNPKSPKTSQNDWQE
jgi:hypothetical protein